MTPFPSLTFWETGTVLGKKLFYKIRTHPYCRMVEMFRQVRFLYDYRDDGKLGRRLNQVMYRVGLPELPEEVVQFWPAAREAVAARLPELLAGARTPMIGEEISS